MLSFSLEIFIRGTYFSTHGNLTCPGQYDCEGDGNGKVWLWDVFDPKPGSFQECTGFS
jgi:hypothetical protein